MLTHAYKYKLRMVILSSGVKVESGLIIYSYSILIARIQFSSCNFPMLRFSDEYVI